MKRDHLFLLGMVAVSCLTGLLAGASCSNYPLLAVVLVLVGLSSTLIGTSVTLHGLSPGRPAELNPMHMQLLKRMFGFQEPEPDPDDHEETCNGKSPVGGHNLPSSASAQESPTTRVP